MEKELNFIAGQMFVAFLTAYCCGVGFPSAALTDGPRDFRRATEACQGGMSEDQGETRSTQRNLIVEKAIRAVTGHE